MANAAQSLDKIKCYADNISELTADLKMQLVDSDTGDWKKVDFNFVRNAVSTGFDQLDESLVECTGDGFKDDIKKFLAEGSVGLTLALRLAFELLGIDV